MAAEEAFVYASGCVDETGEVTFAFEVKPGSLDIVVGPLPASDESGGAPREEGYAEFILRSVCDDFAIDRDQGSCTLRLSRRIAAPAGDAGV
jgi:hypothetical protein